MNKISWLLLSCIKVLPSRESAKWQHEKWSIQAQNQMFVMLVLQYRGGKVFVRRGGSDSETRGGDGKYSVLRGL